MYELFNSNEQFYSIPIENFQRGTLDDEDFDPDMTIVLLEHKTNKPIAAFIALNRAVNSYLKACIVDKTFRRKGIGTKMLNEIIERVQVKYPKISYMSYGDSVPNYFQPGVDFRHTDLFFFLRKNGFK